MESAAGRKTKILATLGPASWSAEMISMLITEGADAFRLNMSHSNPEEIGPVISLIRKVSDDLGRRVSILADLQGPKIRTGKTVNDETVNLVKGYGDNMFDEMEVKGCWLD